MKRYVIFVKTFFIVIHTAGLLYLVYNTTHFAIYLFVFWSKVDFTLKWEVMSGTIVGWMYFIGSWKFVYLGASRRGMIISACICQLLLAIIWVPITLRDGFVIESNFSLLLLMATAFLIGLPLRGLNDK